MSALDITLSPEEKTELKRRVRSATIPQREGRRARIILLAAEGKNRDNIARLSGFSCPTVTDWCQRFQAHRLDGLVDKPGRGRTSSLPEETVRRGLEQVTRPRIGEPRWSCRSMERAAGISSTTVHKLWAANDLKPHLTRTFKLSNDPQAHGSSPCGPTTLESPGVTKVLPGENPSWLRSDGFFIDPELMRLIHSSGFGSNILSHQQLNQDGI